MQQDGFHQLMADGIGGVQGGHGVLEDDGNLVAPDILHFLFGNTHQLLAVHLDGAGDDLAGLFQNLHNGVSGNGLAGAGLPHNAQDLAPVQIKGDAVDGLDFTHGGEKRGMQIVYFKQCHFLRISFLQRFSLGSKASRRPSPNRFRERTIREMAMAGITRR